MRKKLAAILATVATALGLSLLGTLPAYAAGNQTISMDVFCNSDVVAGVWVVDSTNNARSGWVNTITRSGYDAHVTYTGTNAGDSWGVNVGCGIVNGNYGQWKYSTSTFNRSTYKTTTVTYTGVYCVVGLDLGVGTNACTFA